MHGTMNIEKENKLSGQNYKNTNSQTKKIKAIRNQITAKNVPQGRKEFK